MCFKALEVDLPTSSAGPAIPPEPLAVFSFVHGARCKGHDSLRGLGFSRRKVEPVKFEKQNSDHKAGSLISVKEWMIADQPRRVQGR